MIDRLRAHLAGLLSAHTTGVLCAGGALGPQAQPVRYLARGLMIDCLLPRWSDLPYLLHEHPQVVLIVPLDGRQWLRCQGQARPVPAPDWSGLHPDETSPDDRCQIFRLQPDRIERFDPEAGWGFRETLDL